jgi:hypothetical protein
MPAAPSLACYRGRSACVAAGRRHPRCTPSHPLAPLQVRDFIAANQTKLPAAGAQPAAPAKPARLPYEQRAQVAQNGMARRCFEIMVRRGLVLWRLSDARAVLAALAALGTGGLGNAPCCCDCSAPWQQSAGASQAAIDVALAHAPHPSLSPSLSPCPPPPPWRRCARRPTCPWRPTWPPPTRCCGWPSWSGRTCASSRRTSTSSTAGTTRSRSSCSRSRRGGWTCARPPLGGLCTRCAVLGREGWASWYPLPPPPRPGTH